MTTETLSRVTLETLENYRTAWTQAAMAYRAGGHRLVGAVNETLENEVYPRTARFAPRAAERIKEMRGNVSEIIVKGIDQVAERTERAIEIGSDAAVARVNKVADLAAEFENPFIVNSLGTAARLSLPAAKLALAVSSKVAEGATALADVAGAHPVKKAVRKAARTAKRRAAPTVRKAKTQAKATVRRGRKVVKEAAKAPKVQRARRAAKKVVAQVTEAAA